MAKEIDDDVPIYFSPGDDVHGEEVDPEALLEDKPPLEKEWSRYQPAKTLEQAAEEAVKRGEPKIKRLKNRSSRDAAIENSGEHKVPREEAEAGRAEQSDTMQSLQNFLRRSGRFLRPNPIKPSEDGSSDNSSPSGNPASAANQKFEGTNAKVWLVITCVNVFLAGLWCGSFLCPNNKVVTMLRETDSSPASTSSTTAPTVKGDHSIADAVARLNPIVVNIDLRAKRIEPAPVVAPLQPVQRFFQPSPYGNRQQMSRGMPVHQQASGVIISKEGHILTNNHVVPPGTDVRVTLFDHREFNA